MHLNLNCDVAEETTSPAGVELFVKLGNALLGQGALAAACTSFQKALAIQPEHRLARLKLAHVLKLSKKYDAAAEILLGLARAYPDDLAVHKELGKVHFARRQLDAALDSFSHVAKLNPLDPEVHHWLSNIEELRGNLQASQKHFERAIAISPVLRVPASKTPAEFSVLLLFGRGNTNTPPTALVQMAPYESHFLLLLPGVKYDQDQLQGRANLVVNLISDVDQGRDVLPVAVDFVERLGLPVVNHPQAILQTGRDTVATLLSGIAGCRVPRVRYYQRGAAELSGGRETSEAHHECPEFSRIPPREDFVATIVRDAADQFQFPMIVRVAGAHGGHDLEKIDDSAALAAFVAQHPEADFYLSDYIDYRSADGMFRKFRFMFIDGEILPYHLAIDSKWKVHHYTTDMANQLWMQHEEQAFLEHPSEVFGPPQRRALEAIQQAIGLDYFGIDCSLDRDGNVVVFEANASMLVHRDNASFAYKTPHVDRIKRAFDAMLKRRAAAGGGSCGVGGIG